MGKMTLRQYYQWFMEIMTVGGSEKTKPNKAKQSQFYSFIVPRSADSARIINSKRSTQHAERV